MPGTCGSNHRRFPPGGIGVYDGVVGSHAAGARDKPEQRPQSNAITPDAAPYAGLHAPFSGAPVFLSALHAARPGPRPDHFHSVEAANPARSTLQATNRHGERGAILTTRTTINSLRFPGFGKFVGRALATAMVLVAALGIILQSPVSAQAQAQVAVTVEFEHSTYTVAETDDDETMEVTENAVEVKVTLSTDPMRTVIIPITKTNEGGATNADYSGVPASVTFDSGETEQTFTFTATADTVDDDEDKVKLSFGTLPTGVTAGTTAETTVSITDDDDPQVTVSFGAATYSVDEGERV